MSLALLLSLASVALAEPESFQEADDSALPDVEVARPPPSGALPGPVREVALEVADEPLVDRMDAISKELLGRPYVADPLGEGVSPDPDPFARYDVFDCLTYVEEVLALSLAGDPAYAAPIRNRLRYGEEAPSYATRNHFMELEWIPEAIASGWLRDTTAEYGEVVHLEREWTLAGWKNWGRRTRFHHTDEELPVGTMALDVLPLETALEVSERIRPGSILLTVREDRPWVPLWITHVGFVFDDDGERITRHATKMGAGGTRDHALDWYLEHIGEYSNWKTLGVAILEPVEAGPRRAALR